MMPATMEMAHSAPLVFRLMNGPCAVEHDAEDDQDQRAADIDQELNGADEIGAEQEEEARRAGEREQQPGRRAHDIPAHHRGDGAQPPVRAAISQKTNSMLRRT